MKQNKTLMRIFSLLLCLSMVLVYIPVSAFAVSMTGGEKLYLKPNSNWTQANARFAAYFFNKNTNENEWASMTRVEGETDIIYEVTVPTGNWTNVIFCRMNPSASANNWNNKWNQTADLTFDGTKNLFTVKAGAWDGATSTWSEYTPPECLHPEFVDGACTSCGEKLRNVTVVEAENGVVCVDIAQGLAGAIVTVTTIANEGYKPESITVMNGETAVEVKDGQFVIPEGDVTVSATFAEIVDEEYITIYFQNNLEWTDVKAYYWNDTIDNSWPGEFMTLKGKDHTFSADGQYDVYSFHIPVEATKFIINGKKDGNDKQTTDLPVGEEDGICYCLQGENAEGKYITGIVAEPGAQTYEITVVAENGTVSVYESAAEGESVLVTATPAEGYLLESLTVMFGEEELEVVDNQFVMPAGDVTVTAIFREITEEDFVTIYFQNNWKWTDVKIYYWGSENFENPAWPGVAMTKVENPVDGYSNGGTYEVYSFDVPTDVDGFLINGLKDDGTGNLDQTPDIEEGFFDGICYYMYWDNASKAGAMISPDVLGVDTPVNTWNISLGDDIGVNFVVDSNVANLLEFCIGEAVLAKQVTANGDGTSTVSVGLAAAQMADTITIKGCGAAFEKTYSVVDYAKEILADPELAEDAPLRYLVTEMLNYGAAAQEHFNYNAENPANADIFDMPRDEMDLSAVAQTTFEDSIDGLGYYGASLLFRNKIAVRFYFNGSVEDCAFLEGENTYHLPNQTSDGLYYVEIENINPDALDEQITLTVTRGDGEVITVTYGAMNYIKRMYEKEDTSESLKDVLENLYHYHKAAVAYVESLATEA